MDAELFRKQSIVIGNGRVSSVRVGVDMLSLHDNQVAERTVGFKKKKKKFSIVLNEMLLLACVKDLLAMVWGCRLHKCGVNFPFFTESFCKMRPCLLQT